MWTDRRGSRHVTAVRDATNARWTVRRVWMTAILEEARGGGGPELPEGASLT